MPFYGTLKCAFHLKTTRRKREKMRGLLLSLLLLLICHAHAHRKVEPRLPKHEKAQLSQFFKNVSFIHIPKNGGSTMENILLEFGVPFGFAAYRTNALHVKPGETFLINKTSFCTPTPPSSVCQRHGLCADQVCAFWHIPPYTYREPYHSYLLHELRFCHIRNPYTRSVSELFFSHRALKKGPLRKIVEKYTQFLDAFISNPGNEINLYRKHRYYDSTPNILPPPNAPLHPAHQVPAVSLSSASPSLVLPFPFHEDPNDPSFPDFPNCYLNPHEHCHNIPESRFVEPFVTAEYIQDLYYYLEKTDLDCYDILRKLKEKHETELTKSTGLNCNFPLRFEWYAHDFNLFLQRCGPLPDYVHPGMDTPDAKYLEILAVPEVKEKLQELFWEDALRFGYNEYPV